MIKNEYDYIIVGSGSAGSIVANRLSKDPNNRVLVLEAGGWDNYFWLKIPIGYYRAIFDDRFARQFKTEPSEGSGGRSIIWPRGKVLGGSSSINGLNFIRGQKEDFDDWEKLGAKGWDYRSVLPSFRRLENYKGGQDQYHGNLGEMIVSDLKNDNPACQAWIEAAKEFGLPQNSDFNGETTYGVGSYQFSTSGRMRYSSATAFLKPAMKRSNLKVKINALASKVLFKGSNAIGVEWIENNEIKKSYSSKEVILSGGSLQSPQLLQLSGVGPAELLKKYKIPVIHDSPEVGKNLQDHYQVRGIVKLKNNNGSINNQSRNPIKLAEWGLRWLLYGSGPLTCGAGQIGGAACSKHSKNGRPDLQFNVMPLSVDKPGEPLHNYPGFTSSVWQCHPESRGTLKIKSINPKEQAEIRPEYLSKKLDQEVIVEGIKMIRDIFNQPSFKKLWDEEILPGTNVKTDEEILSWAKNNGGTVFHAVGTCRMGGDNNSVVNEKLQVRGVENLRVIDASVMPQVTSANTNAPSLMIGEKGASFLTES